MSANLSLQKFISMHVRRVTDDEIKRPGNAGQYIRANESNTRAEALCVLSGHEDSIEGNIARKNDRGRKLQRQRRRNTARARPDIDDTCSRNRPRFEYGLHNEFG